MSFTGLNFKQYIYGRYILSINIKREIYFITLDSDENRLFKLIKRLKRAQIIMPSALDSNYRGTQTIHLEFGDLEDNNVIYFDRHKRIQIGTQVANGSRGFIQNVHKCCDEYLPLLEQLKIELFESKNTLSQNELHAKRDKILETLFKILNKHFLIHTTNMDFCDLESERRIELEFSDQSKLQKELSKYRVGLLLEKIASYHKPLEERLYYNRKEKYGITPYSFYESKRALTQYLSNYKNSPKSKKFIEFQTQLNEIFQELDTISKN